MKKTTENNTEKCKEKIKKMKVKKKKKIGEK